MVAEHDLLKDQVKDHWERETCGTRYGSDDDRLAYFEEISRARYALEPYILPFADFPSARGLSLLEIGVGAGADFQNWCAHAGHATGVDLTARGIALTAERLALHGVPPDRYTLRRADAEALPFPDTSFDLVYSWGVLHHSPRTDRALAEVFRVLKPGGTARLMVYALHSWVGLQLYLIHGLARGKPLTSIRKVCYEKLESPGTKVYGTAEARRLMESLGFRDVRTSKTLSPGDLLTIKLSDRYQSPVFRVAQAVYPRWLVRAIGPAGGLNLMIAARKPDAA